MPGRKGRLQIYLTTLDKGRRPISLGAAPSFFDLLLSNVHLDTDGPNDSGGPHAVGLRAMVNDRLAQVVNLPRFHLRLAPGTSRRHPQNLFHLVKSVYGVVVDDYNVLVLSDSGRL